MEEKDDIFKFEDFLGGNKMEDLKKMKSNLLKEGLFSDKEDVEDEEINHDFNPYKYDGNTDSIHNKMLGYDDEENLDYIDIEEDEYDDNTNNIHNKMLGYHDDNEEDVEDEHFEDLDVSKSESEDYYKLFRDKSEDFICDIAIEGVNQNDTEVRLIIESDDWNLMFIGEIKNGKCIIPVKKLNILNEGQTGNIKLEVNADGNLFTPWEDKFVVKVSKKVTVNVNENRNNKIKKSESKHKMGVKVNVKK
jgi:hypothetical protein